ncbi:MAG: hypothetical protein GX610_19880 [Rhodococcus sp.]|nr:hypothetical protein [Rhodococcus sp. (in: high G+C Gram-positive bacteria)]
MDVSVLHTSTPEAVQTGSGGAPTDSGLGSRLNWLRAGVMGANDGIVSTAGMVVGVAGAAVGSAALLAAGVAATVAGALSMAVGEYVSVSSQRDALVAQSSDALEAEEDGLTNPWYAAWASMIAFVAGALVPLLTMLLTPASIAVPATFAAVVVALMLTGGTAAHLGDASKLRGATRAVLGGVAAMTVTWLVGSLVGMQL